jgi:RNA polymerase sigma-70 factor (ECF subfamily)
MRLPFSKESEEARLVRGLKSGKPDVQRHVYDLYADRMMALCMRYARDRDDAADTLQEGFIRVFRKIDTFKEEGSLEGWIRRVITNVAIRSYQRNARLHVAVDLDEAEREVSTNTVESDHSAEDLLAMIQRLPDGYRVVFNLYAIEGYSHEEIAEQLEISVGTSKSQLSRARQSLQRMLEQQNGPLKQVSNHA